MLAGAARAKSRISGDVESRRRIENAFRRFRADVLRKEADALDRGTEGMGRIGGMKFF